MNLLRLLFFPFLGIMRRKEKSDTATPPPSQPDRVHIFYGTFPSEIAATDYCLTPIGRNKPEPLTRDLADAMINTSEVEIIFGPSRIAAAVPMLGPNSDGLLRQIGAANTVIIIAEAAFGGLPYTLNDTPSLVYAGPYIAR